ncbi:MAG: leucine-rich repeat protein [Clostridiales bacterium]|nr:leucine-rich repeat protein [Clostridiales bacterium]
MSFNKKLISLILAFVMVLVALPLTDLRSYATDPSDFTYAVISENDKTAELTGYTGSGGDVVVPSTIDGYTVISLDATAFGEENTSIESVYFPGCIESINPMSLAILFACSEFIVDVNNSSYCTYDGVLYSKDGETIVRYPCAKSGLSYSVRSGVETIGFAAFLFSELQEISIPNGVENILQYGFGYNSNLVSITMPNTLISLGEDSFEGCTSLESVSLSTSLSQLGAYSFYGCTSLCDLMIPSSISFIDEGVFDDSGLTTIYGVSGSYAESFANNNNYTFIDIGTLTKGDMNNDNLANPSDIDIMLQLASGNQSATAIQLNLGDLNNDGVVDGFDVAALDRKVYENVD